MGARETALNVLIACRKDGAWSNGILKEYLLRDRLDSRDAALATRMCYGVLQNRLKLDYYLKQLLTGKLRDLHPAVRDILHLGLYQILEMERIPDSAAVNESVALAKKYCRQQRTAPGLVNAVLRRAVRDRNTLQMPKGWQEIYSHPQPLLDLLMDYVGKPRMEAMLKANNEAPKTVAQVNILRTDAPSLTAELEECGVEVQPHPWLENCLVLSGTGDLEKLDPFRKGLFYVQDAAAKWSVLCAQLPANSTVLDCCAAPGGKSFGAAMAMAGTGSITSCDVHPHKVELIRKGAARLGIENLTAQVWDAAVRNEEWVGRMDAVIADVPCSGLGIIRKKPDIRYKNLSEMEALPELQKKILQNQADYVRPGGVLIYSTCTLVREENEGVVESFLAFRPDYTLEPLPTHTPFPENQTGMIALVPGEYDTDGFFICRLRRKA